jgi:hypothetical protein
MHIVFVNALQAKRGAKTYNSGDSLVVTHLTTNPPVSCLNRAERTGSLVLKILWSYVFFRQIDTNIYPFMAERGVLAGTVMTLAWSGL